MTEISSNVPTNQANFQSSVESTAVEELITKGGYADIGDFIETMNGVLEELGIYEGHMDEPQLEPENENISGTSSESLQALMDEDEAASAFEHAFDSAANLLAEGPPKISQQQVTNAAFALQFGEDPSIDEQTLELADMLDDLLMQELASEYGDEGVLESPTSDKKKLKEAISKEKNKIFSKNTKEAVANGKLSESEADKVMFAQNFPELADPSIKEKLNKFDDMAMQELNEKFGVPLGMKVSVDNTEFSRLLTDTYDVSVMGNIEQLADELGLSKEQVATLRFMHYHPEVNFEGKGELMGILQKAEGLALEGLASEFGIPDNFSPNPNQTLFDGIVKGFYRSEFQSQMKNFLLNDPSVTPQNYLQTKMLLEYALDHPNAKGIPPEIAATVKQLSAAAWGKISAQFGIAPGTLPVPVGPLTGGSITPSENSYGHNLANTLESRLNVGLNLAVQMPSGPAKATVLNFLKVISEALSALKEFLYELESVDADIGKSQTRGKLDEKLNQIEYEKIKLKEVQEKMKKMGIVANSLEAIMAVVTIISVIPIIGPIIANIINAIVLALSMVIKMTVKAVVQAVVKAVVKAVGKAVMSAVKAVVKQVAKLATKVMQASTGSMGGAMQALGQMALKAFGSIVKDVAKGLMETGKQAIKGLINAVKGMIKLMQQLLTSPLKAGKGLMKMIQDVGKAMMKGLDTISKAGKPGSTPESREALKQMMDGVVEKFTIYSMQAETAMTAVQGGLSAHNSMMKADVTLIQGKMDEIREMVEAMIKIMQKAIDTLLNGLSGIGEEAAAVTDLLDNIFSSQSAALTQLTQA